MTPLSSGKPTQDQNHSHITITNQLDALDQFNRKGRHSCTWRQLLPWIEKDHRLVVTARTHYTAPLAQRVVLELEESLIITVDISGTSYSASHNLKQDSLLTALDQFQTEIAEMTSLRNTQSKNQMERNNTVTHS